MVIEKYLGNGFLDLVEFISLMRKISKSIKSAFAEVDSNQDGKISVDEMKQVRSFTVNCVTILKENGNTF